MLKLTILFLLITIQVFSQSSNNSEFICNQPYYSFANATYKDKSGNEYLIYSIQDEIHHNFTINLQKWDKNDIKAFADCGITVLEFNQEVVTDSTGTYFYNYPLSANIQVDDSSNIIILLNINYGKSNLDSIYSKSNIIAYKFNKDGVPVWGASGKIIFSQIKNATIENLEILNDGSSHFLVSTFDFLISSAEAKYFGLDENGNTLFESVQSKIVERAYSVPLNYLRDYYLFKSQNTIFVSDFSYNTTSDFTIRTRKYDSTGIYSENSINIPCDPFSLNRIDIQQEKIYLLSQYSSKGEIRKFIFPSGFEVSPNYTLEKMPAEIALNNQFLYYAMGDSLNFINRIQKIDSLGNNYFGADGVQIQQNLTTWIEISSGNDFLFYNDGSLGYLNTFNSEKGTSSGYMTFLKLDYDDHLVQKESRVNDLCSFAGDEYLIKAFIDNKDNSLNLYYGLMNSKIMRLNFYNTNNPQSTACPTISVQINRK